MTFIELALFCLFVRKIILKIRNLVLWVLLALLVVWIVGSAGFLLFPNIQRAAIRLALRYLNIPVFVDYTNAKLVPGHFVFSNPLIIYSDNGTSIIASADTLEIRYSYGKPILIKQLRIINPKIDAKTEHKQKKSSKPTKINLPGIVANNIFIGNAQLSLDESKIDSFTIAGVLRSDKIEGISFKIDSLGINIPSRGRIINLVGKGTYNNANLSGNFKATFKQFATNIEIQNFHLDNNTFDRISLSGNNVSFYQLDSLLKLGFLEGIADARLIISRKTDSLFMLYGDVDGELWGIPLSVADAHLIWNDNSKTLVIDRGSGAIWGARFRQPYLFMDFSAETPKFSAKFGYIDGFNLAAFGGPSTHLSGTAEITSVGLGAQSSMDIRGHLTYSKFEDFLLDGGDIYVKFDAGNIFFPAEQRSFVFIGGNTLHIAGVIDSAGNMNLTLGLRISRPDTFLARYGYDSLHITGAIDGTVKLIGRGGTLGLKPSLVWKNMNIYGVAIDSAIIEGQIKDISSQTGNLIFLGIGGHLGSLPLDTVNLVVRSGNNRYFFRPLEVITPRGTVRATGYMNTGDSLGIRLDGLTYDRITGLSLTEPVFISLEDGISARNLRFSAVNGAIEIDTFSFADTTALFSGKFEGINLSEIAGIFAPDLKLVGVGKGHFDFRINPKSGAGRGIFDLYLAPVSVKNVSLASFSAEAKLSGDTLNIVRCYGRRPGETFNLSGYVLLSDDKTKLTQLNLSVVSEGERPGVLEDLIPGVSAEAGNYNFNLALRGKPDSVSMAGNFSLRGGKIRIEYLDDPIDSLEISVRIRDTLAQIVKFSGRVSSTPLTSGGIFTKVWRFVFGKKPVVGHISADGVVNFKDLRNPAVNISGEMVNLPIKSSEKGFYFITDGTFNLLSPPFHITGDFALRHGILLKLGSPSPEPTKIPVDIDLALSIEDLTVLLTSIAGETESRLKGDLMMSTSEGNLSLLGEMKITEGKYFAYGQNFVVDEGRLNFNKISVIDPELDIAAHTSIGQDEVSVHITGNLSAPQLELYSDNPDFTQEDILRLFAGISDSTVFVDALQDRTRHLLEQYLAHNIERMAQKTLGVDEFSIAPTDENGYSKPSQLRLTVGKKLTSNLFLRYSQTLSDSAQQSVELEYSLSKHIALQLIQTPDGYYRVKLNFKWSY